MEFTVSKLQDEWRKTSSEGKSSFYSDLVYLDPDPVTKLLDGIELPPISISPTATYNDTRIPLSRDLIKRLARAYLHLRALGRDMKGGSRPDLWQDDDISVASHLMNLMDDGHDTSQGYKIVIDNSTKEWDKLSGETGIIGNTLHDCTKVKLDCFLPKMPASLKRKGSNLASGREPSALTSSGV